MCEEYSIFFERWPRDPNYLFYVTDGALAVLENVSFLFC